MTRSIQLLILALTVAVAPFLTAAEFDHSHSRYAKILETHVKDSRVDYAALKKSPKELDAYLAEIASVRPSDFKKWTKDQQLALLLNLYNAHTFKLIINHYPLDSIRDIGFLPGAAWRIQDVRFGGQLITLDYLENKIIRVDYHEPRIHFALVCAAVSCPPLRGEPYAADKLNAQLNEQAKLFLTQAEKNRFDPSNATLWLSPIFKWYDEDFGDSFEGYVASYLPAKDATALKNAKKVKIKHTKYDWSLNKQ